MDSSYPALGLPDPEKQTTHVECDRSGPRTAREPLKWWTRVGLERPPVDQCGVVASDRELRCDAICDSSTRLLWPASNAQQGGACHRLQQRCGQIFARLGNPVLRQPFRELFIGFEPVALKVWAYLPVMDLTARVRALTAADLTVVVRRVLGDDASEPLEWTAESPDWTALTAKGIYLLRGSAQLGSGDEETSWAVVLPAFGAGGPSGHLGPSRRSVAEPVPAEGNRSRSTAGTRRCG